MKTPRILPFAACALLLAPLSASAITRTWDGGGADDNWNNPANWNPTGAPVDGDNLVFPAGTSAETNNTLAGRTFGSLTFQAGTTVTGNAFTITGGITSTPGGTGGTVVIEPNLTLGAAQTFNSGGGALSTLTLSGSVIFGAHSLTLAGSRPLTFGGITGSSVAGSQLLKTGSGQLRFGPSAIFISSSPFTWSSGSLDVDGIFQSALTLTGGTLTGAGTLGVGLDASAGVIVPDEDDLNVSGTTLLRGSVNLRVALIGPSDEHALECSGGTVTIQEQATLELAVNGYVPVRGDSFHVLQKSTGGAITGAFSNAAEGADFADGTSIVRFSYLGGDGNDGTLTTSSTLRTWDGDAVANDNWTDADNWSGNIAPDTGDVLVFPAGIGSTDRGTDNDFPNDKTFRQLVFNGGDFTVRGNRFRLTHGISTLAGQFTTIDADVVLARDQTFELNGTLHLDLLDEIDTAGRTLTLFGNGRLDGTVTGSGRVVVASGSAPTFSANSTYTGETVIEGDLNVINRDEALGAPSSGTTLHGLLNFDLQSGAGNAGEFNLDEPLVMMPGSVVRGENHVSGFGVMTILNLRGGLELRGRGLMSFQDDVHGELMISSTIRGEGDLDFSCTATLAGESPNVFTGSTHVTRSTVILEKSSPGVIAVPSPQLFIGPGDLDVAGDINADAVETREDEQIANDCHVEVREAAELRIGNITGRTETIGSLTLSGTNPELPAGTVTGPQGSLLALTGDIIRTATDRCTIDMALRITKPVTVLQTNQPGNLEFDRPLTRSGGAVLRLTGSGLVKVNSSAAVTFEVQRGVLSFSDNNDGDASASAVFLDGGTVQGNGRCGPVTSLAGGGFLSGTEQSGPGVLTTGSLTLAAPARLAIPQISGAGSTGYNQVTVMGSVSLGGAILELQYLPGFNVTVGQSIFPLLNDGTDAITGTFAGLPQGAFIPVPAAHGGGGWIISYTGGTGNDVALTRVSGPPPAEVQPVVTTVTFGAPDGLGNLPVTIGGKGTPGASYRLENSVDLTGWTPEGTAQTANATTGALNFTSTASLPVRLKQFWRFRRQ